MKFRNKKNVAKLSNSMEQILKPNLKKIKISNSIVIGGMIAFGKSTLASKIHESIEDSKIVYELNDEDQLMHLLLEKMYERKNNTLYGSVFQLYFILNRFDNYKNSCNGKNLTIFDRSIFEDWLFAHENIVRPSVFSYYDSLWKDVANELIYQYGVPKLYVILSGNWSLFKERLFKRDRKIEIDNFEKNRTYFKKLLEIYEDYMINVCKDFGIDYIVVDATKSVDELSQIVLEKVNSLSDAHKKMHKKEIKRLENFAEENSIIESEAFSSPTFATRITQLMEKLLSSTELNIIQMLNGLGPYVSKKNYDEVSSETNLSISKIKSLERVSIKKIRQSSKTINLESFLKTV